MPQLSASPDTSGPRDFSGDSRHASPWTARLYNDAVACGKDHPAVFPGPVARRGARGRCSVTRSELVFVGYKTFKLICYYVLMEAV